MIICPNLSNPEVAREFNELVQATSELAAYHIWSLNNGNAIDRAPNGAPSKLFLTLLEYYKGDRTKAIQAKAKTYGRSFLDWFGDWINDSTNASKVVDENGEPKVMYHATPWGKFSIFKQFQPNTGDRTKAGELYFGNSERMVLRYTRGEFNKGNSSPEVYAVFLNIKNPYKNAEVINKQQLDDILEDLKNYLTPEEFESIQNEVYDSWNTNEKYNLPYHSYNVYNTLANYFKNNNKDRFYEVIRNLRNSGHKDGMFFLTKEEWEGQPINFREDIKRQVWVMDPNQIKSVDNQGPTPYEGTFSRENDDIFDDNKQLLLVLKNLGQELMKKCKGQ